jgi:type IV secretion system protein VirB10
MSDTAPQDRTVSPVAGSRRAVLSGRTRQVAILATGVCASMMMGLGIYSAFNDSGPATKPVDTGANSIGQTVANPPETVVKKQEEAAATKKEERKEEAPATVAQVTPNYVVYPVGGAGSFQVSPSAVKEDKPEGTAGAGASRAKDNAEQTRVAFKPSVIEGGKAGPAIRLTYVMMPQMIPCALDTAMDSTLAGPILCHTTQDVLSPSHIVLIPRGSTVVGSYKSDIRTGQHRMFALTGNVVTQDGIPVSLNSPIADGLGRTGAEGDVDNHYPERFGAAVALTAVQAGISLGQAALTKGSQTNTNFNFGGGGGSNNGIEGLAMEILRQQGAIAPTISVPPGQVVQIVVDHTIDFSDALHVELK